jgi:hypothetical protein
MYMYQTTTTTIILNCQTCSKVDRRRNSCHDNYLVVHYLVVHYLGCSRSCESFLQSQTNTSYERLVEPTSGWQLLL